MGHSIFVSKAVTNDRPRRIALHRKFLSEGRPLEWVTHFRDEKSYNLSEGNYVTSFQAGCVDYVRRGLANGLGTEPLVTVGLAEHTPDKGCDRCVFLGTVEDWEPIDVCICTEDEAHVQYVVRPANANAVHIPVLDFAGMVHGGGLMDRPSQAISQALAERRKRKAHYG